MLDGMFFSFLRGLGQGRLMQSVQGAGCRLSFSGSQVPSPSITTVNCLP